MLKEQAIVVAEAAVMAEAAGADESMMVRSAQNLGWERVMMKALRGPGRAVQSSSSLAPGFI